ncbi:hypothetical protein P5F42_09410 [Clostridium perfringens]|nr:hypothetical protein [Clostridium perfringens]
MYNFLIAGHTKYGLKKDTLCKSVLKCNDEAIKENVIIAPWWEPTIFKDIESELIVDTSIKIWNCKLFDDNNVSYHVVPNFSVDTIFAQFAHLDYIMKLGCKSIEMETAAAFKACSICNIPIAAIFNVSDNSIKNKSIYNGKTESELKYRKKVRNEIIPQIIYSLL